MNVGIGEKGRNELLPGAGKGVHIAIDPGPGDMLCLGIRICVRQDGRAGIICREVARLHLDIEVHIVGPGKVERMLVV